MSFLTGRGAIATRLSRRRATLTVCLAVMLGAGGWVARWERSVSSIRRSPAPEPVVPIAARGDVAITPQIREAYGRLPLSFEANVGQTDPQVQFLSRGSGYSLFLTATGAVISLGQPVSNADATARGREEVPTPSAAPAGRPKTSQGVAVRMQFVGSNPRAPVAGMNRLPGNVNYMVGKDPAQWRTGIHTYAKVTYSDVYPDVDVVYYGRQRQLEYDFVVRPGGDPALIGVRFEGADTVSVDARGDLVLATPSGEIRHRRPFIYQDRDGERRVVEGAYRLTGPNEVRFSLASYDASRPLVIDPVIEYATFLGGGQDDSGFGIAVDTTGHAYVTGRTASVNFPITVGAFDATSNGFDAFVTKLNPDGSALDYSTYFGGTGADIGWAIAVDTAGNAYVTGYTNSANFPTTPGAIDTTFNGLIDAFVTKLNPAGAALDYSTYLGGGTEDYGMGIVVDAAGSAHITGYTDAGNFPTTVGAFDPTFNGLVDAFVSKLNFAGSVLEYSTYLGGNRNDMGRGIAIDSDGNAYVTGDTSSGAAGPPNFPTTVGAFDTTFNGFIDVFVTKLNLTGSTLEYSTYLGGSSFDAGRGIAVDAAGHAYVTGTGSSGFPTTPGAFDTTFNMSNDGFVTKLNRAGSALDYSTYVGGSAVDGGLGIAIDTTGAAFVTGQTASHDFPISTEAFDATYSTNDTFLTKVNLDGSALDYSTYLGGSSFDNGFGVAVDLAGAAFVTGQTGSADFPTTPGAFDMTFNGGGADAFVVKFAFVQDQDGDDDGIDDASDNCSVLANPDQANYDGDAQGDACDVDDDNDGVLDAADNCVVTANPAQENADGDDQGDVCDNDDDNDGVPDTTDNCALAANPGQQNVDGDAQGDVCDPDDDNDGVLDADDNCSVLANADQANTDGDTQGDACDPDDDNDTVPDASDNCALATNPGQENADGDPQGDACDADDDNDGVPDTTDNCVFTPNPSQGDIDGDGQGDACEPFSFPAGGLFAIGDMTPHSLGTTVNFWGAQWGKNNALSGGPAPNAFKGFENSNGVPACGATWTSRSGNSAVPPGAVAPYTAVIVSSHITKTGSTISGNVREIVIVYTQPGYGPNPGHAGLGTVVHTLCRN
jgi:hypothetical protein